MISRKALQNCFATGLLLSALSSSAQEPMSIDHRYSPPWWQTLVCLPDDPVKTLVGKEGQVFGDYDYKGPRNFSFSIHFDSRQPSVWKQQTLPSALVPMTITEKQAGVIGITEKTFLEIPGAPLLNSIQRYDSRRVEMNWSTPRQPCDSAFYDVAYGKKGLSGEGIVEFHIRVQPGATYQATLGFCEGKYETAGIRTMRIYTEGGAQMDIDPVADFGAHVPGTYTLKATDADKDGILTIVVSNRPGAKDRDAIVNGLWLFNGAVPPAASIITGKENKHAALYARCAYVDMPQRRYHDLVTLHNTDAKTSVFYPVIRYKGIETLTQEGKDIRIGRETVINTGLPIDSVSSDTAGSYTIHLHPVTLKANTTTRLALTVSRFFPAGTHYQPDVATAAAQASRTIAWWQQHCPSATAITVPDNGIQSIVQSSLRNIFQARDIRKGNKSFHVGPTIYRGLWLADGSYLLELATMLGDTKDVRSCIDYLTHYQLPGGGFEMIETFHKENGLVMFMLTRHAMLTQDKAWLKANWNVIQGCIRRINYLRSLALRDSTKPYYGLLPNGNVDGGIQHGNDYSNTEYCLAGMRWAIQGAKWLDRQSEAVEWQRYYDTLYGNFLARAVKDVRKDEFGNPYLPVMINNEQNQLPQRGQWAFCQSVYPGQIYDNDSVARRMAKATVDMLASHKEEGLVLTTGWMDGGLWTYFTSFYAHALQWFGEGRQVPQLLYDFGNHSSPTMVWREEQKPQGKGNDEVGDMPHNWASAEFIRTVVHMIQLDHGKDLHLFESMPAQWARPGAVTALKAIHTPFGRMDLRFAVRKDGKSASLHLAFLDKTALPENIRIYKKSWLGSDDVQTIQPRSIIDTEILF